MPRRRWLRRRRKKKFYNFRKVEDDDNVILDNFEDKDPFDTSAYDDIAGVLEEELGFESLAKRDPKDEPQDGIEEGPGVNATKLFFLCRWRWWKIS